METKAFLGARIRELRKKTGFKQEALAEILNIDPKHLSKIECGRSFPSFDLLDKIAKTLQVKPCEILKVEHLKQKEEIIDEISSLLNSANVDKLRLCYKVLKNILHG